jgi:hypothetical protein
MQWYWVVISGVTLLALGAGFGSYYTFRCLKHHVKLTSGMLRKISNEMYVIKIGSFGVGQRLIAVEKRLHIAVERQQELVAQDLGYAPYAQAAKLMDMGAGVVDLVQKCGISKAEAELIELMHKQMKASGRANH